MRIPLASRYEQTLSTIFSCLSVTLFVLLILLFFNLVPNVRNVIIALMIMISSILAIRSFYNERREELFDLSLPTLFESGLLVFQSSMNRCAIFFAFDLVKMNFPKVSFQRSLTILLKILPISTILALEWTTQRECFITFYIKLDKASFLTQARELLENINQSFSAILGEKNIRLLKGGELMRHFSMGIPGRLAKISVSGRYGIHIQTDRIHTKRAMATLRTERVDELDTILNNLDTNKNLRLILPMKKTENATILTKSFILVSNNPVSCDSVQIERTLFQSINQIPASKLIQLFGDVLTRNQIYEPKIELDLQETAIKIINLLSTPWPKRIESKLNAAAHQDQKSAPINPFTWRMLLNEQLSDLKLSYLKDNLVVLDRVPLRVDVQVDNLLFFIISQTKESHVKWFIQKIIRFLEKDETKTVILLLTQNQKTRLAQTGLSKLTETHRAHLIRTKKELATLLKNLNPRLLKKQNSLAQVA